jgi:hypothetical protein
MKVNSYRPSKKDREDKSTLMEINTSDSITKEDPMEKENIFGKTEIVTKANSKMD